MPRDTPSLRILQVTPYAPSAWAYGGIPRVVEMTVDGLAARGHHVTVCTTDVRDASSRLGDRPCTTLPDGTPAGGVEWKVFPNLSNRLAYRHQLFTPIGLGRFLRHHAARFDVAHLHACRNLPGAIAARHLHAAGVPYLLAPNGTAPRLERAWMAKRIFDAAAGRRMLDQAARVLAVSRAECRQLADLGVPPARIARVPNPVNVGQFAQPSVSGRFRQRMGIGDGPLVVYLGKLTPRKGVDVLLHSLPRLARHDATLVIGGNDMGAGPSLHRLVRALNLGSRVIFTGLLEGRHRLDALADADVVAYPSRDEIFGLVPLEALLSGTPVVVCDDSGCGEIVGETGGGVIVRHGDVSALAAALDDVIADNPTWRGRAAVAATRVRALYAPEIVTAQLELVYRSMTNADVAVAS